MRKGEKKVPGCCGMRREFRKAEEPDVVSLHAVFTLSNILHEASPALKRNCTYLVENGELYPSFIF